MRIELLCTLCLLAFADPARASAQPEETELFRASHVLTASGPPFVPGEVEVRGERIVRVGRKLDVTPGTRVVDLGEAWISPGFIDAGWRAFPRRERGGRAASPAWRWSDVLDRQHPLRDVARSGGVTAAVAIPDPETSIDGWAPLIRFRPDGLEVLREQAVLCGRIGGEDPESSLEAANQLVALLGEGARAQRAWEAYSAELERHQEARSLGLAPSDPPRPPGLPRHLGELQAVLDGGAPLRLDVERWQPIRRLIETEALASLRIWVTGPLTPSEDGLPSDGFAFSVPPHSLRRLGERAPAEAARWLEEGVEVVFASEELGDPSYLRFEAARAIAQGASRDEVLAALTVVPARQLGVEDDLGSIAPGRLTDLVVWTGDPFDSRSRVLRVVCGERPR